MYVQGRERLVQWLERQLVGPAKRSGANGLLDVSPLDRYPVGVLHPVLSEEPGIDLAAEAHQEVVHGVGGAESQWSSDLCSAEDEDESADDGQGDDESRAAPVRRRRYVPPSSVGFSFCVEGDMQLRIEASAAVYEAKEKTGRDEGGRFMAPRYERKALSPEIVAYSGGEFQRGAIWDSRGGIDIRAREHAAGTVLTVTLYNGQSWDSHDTQARMPGAPHPQSRRVQSSLFEARLECYVEQGKVVDYPRVDPSLMTEEEQELELQYRDRHIFAVGHGASADWSLSPDGTPRIIRADFLPKVETPIVTVEPVGDASVLQFERLSAEDLPLDGLRSFVAEYGVWIRERLDEAGRQSDPHDRQAAHRICERMNAALERMNAGVDFLAAQPDAALAFRRANQAIHKSMAIFAASGKDWAWRPFQLGFLLATIASTVAEEHDDRDVLDLIWFQTGGGKTEAYLGLIAFLLVWRRLRHGEQGGGTAAFMRYTLRLLTRQQFERATGVICALELLRRGEPHRLGNEPFSVGIWVGRNVCPNHIKGAEEILDRVRAGDEAARDSLLLARCPWCRERFDPRDGYRASMLDFTFHCVNGECDFGRCDQPLPCRVVDESLYRHPPSLLIATIDKFARLAWEGGASAFFGAPADGPARRAPDLVLQDELHLISGPLGSVAGLYEAGVETAIRCRGVKPKYVASTATIRMAAEQVKALYGRRMAVFPPPGLSCDDSWFARANRGDPGRLYLGYLAPLRDRQRCLVPLASALLAAPLVVFCDEGKDDAEALFEAWWTSIVYHGSLRGVATSSNTFDSEVRDFGQRLIDEYIEIRHGDDEGARGRADRDVIVRELRHRFGEAEIEQLWSRHTAEEIASIFERLGKSRNSPGCLDAVLSTNMVSVGLDVARLALMLVNGQPLTTGEYVQATSRVGRSEVPGIVVANYYRDQARSLSHYESFRAYHESFYRFVEPTSVTPYTYQVRQRALHAALVIALRHSLEGLRDNKAAGSFDRTDPAVSVVVTELKARVERARANSDGSADVAEHIEKLVRSWHEEVEQCSRDKAALRYRSRDRAYRPLLYGWEDREHIHGLWVTLQSMRSVESPAALRLTW